MKASLRNDVIRNSLWIGALAVAVVVLIGGSLTKLHRDRTRITSLRAEVRQRQSQLGDLLPAGDLPRRVEAAQATLIGWTEMIDNEASRLAELSRTARTAGVRIVSVRGTEHDRAADSSVATTGYALQGVGSYAQIGAFLDEIEVARGVAGTDDVEIVQDPESPQSMLQASLTVTWYAPDTSGAPAEETP